MRKVTVVVRDHASQLEAGFSVSVDLPREALLFDVQKAGLERVLTRFFDPQIREAFLRSRKAKIKAAR